MYLLILITVLILYNLSIHRFLEEKWHVLLSIVLSSGIIVWVVRDPSISLSDVGINLSGFISGIIYGLLSLLVIAVVIIIATSVPMFREHLKDERSKHLSIKQLAYKTLVNIPIGTVFLEEVVFRGVMLALLMTSYSTTVAVVVSSLLFGLWHILPAVTNITTNDSLRGANRPSFLVVLGTVVVTFFAGIAFSWLRLASGSLLAPMIAHYATNSGGTIAAWISHKLK